MNHERLIVLPDPERDDVCHVVLHTPSGVRWYRIDTDDTHEPLPVPPADPVRPGAPPT